LIQVKAMSDIGHYLATRGGVGAVTTPQATPQPSQKSTMRDD